MANPIDDDDQLALSLGRAAGRWALVENAIEMLFLEMIGTDAKRATTVYRFFRSNHNQRDVLTRLASIYLADEEDLGKQLGEHLNRYRELAERRNLLLHNAFGYDTTDDARPVYQMRRAPSGAENSFVRFPITSGDIAEFAEESRKLFDDLIAYRHDVFERMRGRLEEQLQASLKKHPEPPLDLGGGLLGAFLRSP